MCVGRPTKICQIEIQKLELDYMFLDLGRIFFENHYVIQYTRNIVPSLPCMYFDAQFQRRVGNYTEEATISVLVLACTCIKNELRQFFFPDIFSSIKTI